MSVLAAMRERKARRIVEPRRRAVHDLGDECQRLQRGRAELLEQQERREIAQLALVGEGEDGAEPALVDVGAADRVPERHLEAPDLRECGGRVGSRDGQAAGAPALRNENTCQLPRGPGRSLTENTPRVYD